MAVFIPISFLSGMVGQFFKQFGFNGRFRAFYIADRRFYDAPMLSAYWYKSTGKKTKKEGLLCSGIYNISTVWESFYKELLGYYGEILAWSLSNKKKVLFGLFVPLYRFIIHNTVHRKRFYELRQGFFSVNFETYPGAPLAKMDGYIKELEINISAEKSVDSYFAMAGSNGCVKLIQPGNDLCSHEIPGTRVTSHGHHKSDWIGEGNTKRPWEQGKGTHKRAELDKYYNATIGMLGSDESSTPILINITGPDLNILRDLSVKVKKIIMETPGTADAIPAWNQGNPR